MKPPRLLIVLGAVGLVLVVAPVATITVLRIPENELLRRTESTLITQGAALAAIFAAEMSPTGDAVPDRTLRIVEASLDLFNAEVHASAGPPPPRPAGITPNPVALAAGERLMPALINTQRTTLAGIRLADRRGVIVASTRPDDIGHMLTHQFEVLDAMDGRAASLLREREPSRGRAARSNEQLSSPSRMAPFRVFVALPVWHGDKVVGVVSLSRTPMSLNKATFLYRDKLLLSAAVVFAVVLLLVLIVVLVIARPLRGLAQQARQIAADGAAPALTWPGTAEVAEVSHTMTTMAHALTERSRYVETFANNVSHAFKTPLTSVKGALELLTDHGDMTENQRARFLSIARADTDRMERLVGRLMALAQADVAPRGGRCDLDALLRTLQQRYRNDHVVIRIVGEGTWVALAVEALESVFCALFDNAKEHGAASPQIRVQIHSSETGRLMVDVHDNGPGLAPSVAPQVFDPFYSTAKDRGGTGLGLPVARAIVVANAGGLAHLPTDTGTCFRLWLPVAAHAGA